MNTKPKFWDKIFGATPGDGEMQSKEALSFSLCGFGQNLICTIIGSYITIFMTDAVGFSATSVAILMLLARLYDAGNDPIMGSIVDRTRTKWGKCRPYLKWMAFPIGAMTIVCFLPWFPNNTGGFVALSLMYLLWGMIYTVADVPFWGLATAMCDDTYRRGTMLTVARLFCTAGAGIVTVVVPIITSNVTAADSSIVTLMQTIISNLSLTKESLVNVATATAASTNVNVIDAVNKLTEAKINLDVTGAEFLAMQEGFQAKIGETLRFTYFISAIVCVVIAMPLFMIGFKNTRERNQSLTKAPSLKHNFKLLFKNTPLMLIVLSGIGGAGRMMFNYTGGLYFAKYVLADVSILGGALQGEGLYTLFTMAIVPGGLIASLLVPLCTKKFGKRNTYIVSHLVGGVAMLFAFIFGIAYDHGNYSHTATIVILTIALVIAGVPVGFSNVLTYAMIGDTVEYLELKTGERAEGICFAMQTLMNKIGMALGAFIGVLAYGIIQDRTTGDVSVVNNASALTSADKDTFWYMLVLIGAISFFLSVIPLFFYKFNEKEQQEAIVILKERRAKAALEAQGATASFGDEAAVVEPEAVNDVSEAEVVYDPDKE